MVNPVPRFGDCVVISLGKNDVMSVKLNENCVSQTRFGALKHNDVVGKAYGTKITTSRGYVHILPMDPVLWSETLPHRTQIIYPTDASLIVGGLDLVPGKRVFEAGTGSGSLTHFLAQAIAPDGCVQTFDFHAERVEHARNEFKEHLLDHVVKVDHRDVCTDYFPVVGDPDNQLGVDAVILDLPQPWKVVPHLPKVYRPTSGGRLCLFSPCIEQVQRSCNMLRQTGFVHIKTVECIQREYDIVRAVLNVPNMGQHEAIASLQTQVQPSDPEFKHQITRAILPPPATARLGKRNRKRQREEHKSNGTEKPTELDQHQTTGQEPRADSESIENDNAPFSWEAILRSKMTGHTGYLTFASWLARTDELDAQKKNDVQSVIESDKHEETSTN